MSEPDRYEAKANAVYAAKDFENDPVGNIAAALRQAADEALERAVNVCRAKAKRMRKYAAETLDKESAPKAEACADQADDCADATHDLRALASPTRDSGRASPTRASRLRISFT